MTGICKPNTTGKTHVVHNLQIWQCAEKCLFAKLDCCEMQSVYCILTLKLKLEAMTTAEIGDVDSKDDIFSCCRISSHAKVLRPIKKES